MKTPHHQVQPLKEEQTLIHRHCQADAECVVAINGCCNCANGGLPIAVNRDQREAFRSSLHCELNAGCNEEGVMQPCDAGSAVCRNALCIYTTP